MLLYSLQSLLEEHAAADFDNPIVLLVCPDRKEAARGDRDTANQQLSPWPRDTAGQLAGHVANCLVSPQPEPAEAVETMHLPDPGRAGLPTAR